MTGGFPHSEILGSKLAYQLPKAYRRLLRPSSPLTAKASTVCAYSLDHITQNNLLGLYQMQYVLVSEHSYTLRLAHLYKRRFYKHH